MTASNGPAGTENIGNGANARGKVQTEIQQISKVVGRKLLVYVLRTCGGGDSVRQVNDQGKLKLILERLQNVQRGTKRLKALIGTVGLEALREECEKLKLPGLTTDDIPDSKTLRKLIERLETRVKAVQGLGIQPPIEAASRLRMRFRSRQGA